MPRPKRKRIISRLPNIEGFKPIGIPARHLKFLNLSIDEYESVKLTDYQGLNQEEAAEIMGVSRPTFTRIYESARKTIAKVLVEGKAMVISGGDVDFQEKVLSCKRCNRMFHHDTIKIHEQKCNN